MCPAHNAHRFSFMCWGLEAFVPRISAGTPIQDKWREFHLWYSKHWKMKSQRHQVFPENISVTLNNPQQLMTSSCFSHYICQCFEKHTWNSTNLHCIWVAEVSDVCISNPLHIKLQDQILQGFLTLLVNWPFNPEDWKEFLILIFFRLHFLRMIPLTKRLKGNPLAALSCWEAIRLKASMCRKLCVFQQESVETARGTVRRFDSWSFVRCPSSRAAAVIPAETPEAGT